MGSTGKNQNTAPDVFNGMLGERKTVDSVTMSDYFINSKDDSEPKRLKF